MANYTVISDGILTGTIADLSPTTRLAWLAVLFEAEKLRGRVKLPIRVLAKRASISNEEAAEALRVFQEPDPLSSSQMNEGRRLIPIPGQEGWYEVVTWEKHAEERQRYFATLRQQRHRAKKAAGGNGAAE